ncbi:hypothetical protein RHGRI_036714 [Rhododendron griersonianum]|uniref:ribonuclease P n=1 Tax=Rhododendron griersonianum TaxID=479676 RepID=A0AAV6HUE5_9ERIC|nr:hypothetical protein RHGRI_036714 [Rhododendron griersonianum]
MRKNHNHTPESKFRHDLDLCSKKKSLPAAISLYETALSDKLRLNHYHFNALLYVCSETVTDPSNRASAFEFGFRVFDRMLAGDVNPTEATVTAVARLAAAVGDGDRAFGLVKTMGEYTVTPKLRSLEPALFCYCRNLEADKAYEVEDYMVSVGVTAEEPDLAALLKVSADTGRGERVYGYLHKLRRAVRCVSESTAEIIKGWFGGAGAGEVGVEEWESERVEEAVLRNGGGWHGLGWLGKGEWDVRRVNVDVGGGCVSCGEQLVCVDIDRDETEKFAQAVAGLAMEREVQSNFKDFQDWLDTHAEYEAIVDGANIGLYQQNFAEEQLDAVVKELHSRSNKWPLVVLHNKRVKSLLENASNRKLLEEWIAQGVLYGTPHGSNDDWYWLYAAVKLKCLLVTNDEMRDHIFELLGRSFFLKWKERHQVRYTFLKGDLKLEMPPSYSLVIQESEKGNWHVPLAGEWTDESSRTWLCITRPGSCEASGRDNHKLVKSCDAKSISNDKLHGNSDSSPIRDKQTSTTGKRKERSVSPSRLDC